MYNPVIINNKWTIIREVGEGTFGKVYLGKYKEKKVAIKREKIKGTLEKEFNLYKILNNHCGIAKLLWYGSYTIYNVLVIDFIGPSLTDIRSYIFQFRFIFIKNLILQLVLIL